MPGLLDALLWLPTKVLAHYLKPVSAMIDEIADNAEAAIAKYAEEIDL